MQLLITLCITLRPKLLNNILYQIIWLIFHYLINGIDEVLYIYLFYLSHLM